MLFTVLSLCAVLAGCKAVNESVADRMRYERPFSEPIPMAEDNFTAILNEYFDPVDDPVAAPSPEATDSLDQVLNFSEQPPMGNETASEGCTCVPYFSCRENQTTFGENLIDLRVTNDPCDYISVCCKPEYIQGDELPTTPRTTLSQPIKPTWHTCGHRNFDGVSSLSITGAVNNESQFGEFPWMVAVLSPTIIGGVEMNAFQCGGSLIHPQVVLTAAHWVKGKEDLSVRVGEWDTQRTFEPLPFQTRKVKEVVIHEQFNNKTGYNDIALLILESPVDLAPHVATICLPEQGENVDQQMCTASGWGKNVFGKKGKYQVILKKVDLPIVSGIKCQAALRKTRLGLSFKLHSSFICAGGVIGRDTCTGDGGSPLVCPKKESSGTYVQAGIVSWGIGCNSETPGVYVDVSQFRNWIDSKLNLNGFV